MGERALLEQTNYRWIDRHKGREGDSVGLLGAAASPSMGKGQERTLGSVPECKLIPVTARPSPELHLAGKGLRAGGQD